MDIIDKIAAGLADDPNVFLEQDDEEAMDKLALGDKPSPEQEKKWKEAKKEADRTGKSPLELMQSKDEKPGIVGATGVKEDFILQLVDLIDEELD